MDFQRRLWIQHKILDAAEKLWYAEQRQFITDRTPLDMAAYTLADIQGAAEVDFSELEKYLERCFKTTNELFKILVLIQPGIPLLTDYLQVAHRPQAIGHLLR